MIDRRDLYRAAALIVVVCAAYAAALGAGFFSDDYQWLGRMNPTLERPSYLFSIFYRDFNPVLHASFLLDWIVGGPNAVVYHADSILIHAVCAGLLLLLCKRASGNSWLAALAALAWALNVRISETVIWAAARGHSLATLFVLAALLALGSRARWREVVGVALLVLGLLTKETALFPIALVPFFVPEPRRAWRLYGALATVGVAFVLFNLLAKPEFHTSPAGPAALLLKVPFILLRPLGLGDFYDFSWLLLLFVLAAYVAITFLLRRTPALVGLLWVAVCTVPIIPLDKLSSRYLYMMSAGYALVLCGVVPWIAQHIRDRSLRRIVAGLALTGLLIMTAGNLVNIQREIGDYAILARPYRECVEALGPHLRAVAPGDTVVIVDDGPRDAIRSLTDEIAARRNINKLIPYRAGAVDGLIELPDLLNTVRRTPGLLGYVAELEASGLPCYVYYDGTRAWAADVVPDRPSPPERVFTARWGEARGFFGDDGG